MIGINPGVLAYTLPVQAQLIGVNNDTSRQTPIPEPGANRAANPVRPINDDYETQGAQRHTGVGLNAGRPEPATQSERNEQADPANSETGFNQNDRGTTDDSRQHDRASPEEERRLQQLVRSLAARDAEVRAHEAAHVNVGGQYAGSATFQYQRGPDGKSYAVGGEVPIDASPVPDDPEATIRKLQTVANAALAPADPSSADQRIAARAQAGIAEARAELALKRRLEAAAAEAERLQKEGKTEKVDAGRVRYSTDSETYIPNPFGARPIRAGIGSQTRPDKYIGSNNLVGISLQSPTEFSATLSRYGVTEQPEQRFSAVA